MPTLMCLLVGEKNHYFSNWETKIQKFIGNGNPTPSSCIAIPFDLNSGTAKDNS